MKFTQYTLNQVAGFDNQILAQQLVYNQKDFWNLTWGTQGQSTSGWNTGPAYPINLTDATIDAQIIRRDIINIEDSRTGMNFDIVDYPFPAPITTVTATSSTGNILTCLDTRQLFVGQPVRFTGTVFGTVAINTTYYVNTIITATTFTISLNPPGPGIVPEYVSDDTGLMVINRVAPTAVSLPITNREDLLGSFTMTIDDDTWGVIAGDPELNINSNNPVCFTGRIKISFPAVGIVPAYDESIFLLFYIVSDGVVN
jgi:hypothetical protein